MANKSLVLVTKRTCSVAAGTSQTTAGKEFGPALGLHACVAVWSLARDALVDAIRGCGALNQASHATRTSRAVLHLVFHAVPGAGVARGALTAAELQVLVELRMAAIGPNLLVRVVQAVASSDLCLLLGLLSLSLSLKPHLLGSAQLPQFQAAVLSGGKAHVLGGEGGLLVGQVVGQGSSGESKEGKEQHQGSTRARHVLGEVRCLLESDVCRAEQLRDASTSA
ncbi:unnamed protein product [Polarella glacialis]|uniref:Uncharacterized protein n=1 Tax=Polarella glacialis TaxID=89957 RepID=A0A813DDX7_POLGL|nr:unnamed protein product [Polarella glacialis]